MLWWMLLGFGWTPDADDDGVPDARDECRTLPENHNGYADDDGCPDYLATVQVQPTLDGPTVVAETRLVRENGEVLGPILGREPVFPEMLMPGDLVAAIARRGCYIDEAILEVHDGLNQVPLSLEPRWDATLELTVLADGAPADGVVLEVLDAAPEGCEPPIGGALPRGQVALAVGAGTLDLRLTAEGRAAVSTTVAVPPEGLVQLVVELPDEQVVHELERVHFAYDSAELPDPAHEILAATAAVLKAHPALRLTLQGHTDERGLRFYNLALGERRAMAVAEALIELGVAPEQLNVVTVGEDRPLLIGEGPSVWSANRRVEFEITHDPQGVADGTVGDPVSEDAGWVDTDLDGVPDALEDEGGD